jgi:hypothetical protein
MNEYCFVLIIFHTVQLLFWRHKLTHWFLCRKIISTTDVFPCVWPGSIDQGSNKSNALEMYAPSSYNGTVNAETLSSISEKSRTSTGHEVIIQIK